MGFTSRFQLEDLSVEQVPVFLHGDSILNLLL